MDKPEIERKWVLPAMPRVTFDRCTSIDQGYLVDELRLRRRVPFPPTAGGARHTLTIKRGESMIRDEWEEPIPAWVFTLLWPHTRGWRLSKLRHVINTPQGTVEVDEYTGKLAGLVVMEYEAASEQAAEAFVFPEWAQAAEEVTGDSRYSNAYLAREGKP